MKTIPITIALLAALPFSALTKPETAPDAEASRQFEHGVQLLYSGKDSAGAIRVFRSLISAKPPYELAISARLHLAGLHLSRGEKQSGLKALDEAVKLIRNARHASSRKPGEEKGNQDLPALQALSGQFEDGTPPWPDLAYFLEPAMKEVAGALAPHGAYTPPQQLGPQLDLPAFGVGTILKGFPDGIHITDVVRTSPAWNAGVQTGWVITAVGGKTWQEYERKEENAIKAIRGPEGTNIILTFRLPSGAERDISLVRKRIDRTFTEGVFSHRFQPDGSPRWAAEDGIVTAVVSSFYGAEDPLDRRGDVVVDLRAAFTVLPASKAYLLDLRGTRGGTLEQAVKVADLFLKKGLIVQNRYPDRTTDFPATAGNDLPELPMAVLVNSSTAYVAELVAAALQDQGRAKIIGRRTFGRGVVRTFYDIPGGAVIMAPLSNLIRSAGMRLERDHDMTDKDSWGVTPDLVVPPLESPDAARKDSANIRAPEDNLQRHWDATPPDQRDAALQEDVQYRAAIEYLKAVLAKK